MGHSDIQTTLNVSGHVIEPAQEEVDEKTQLTASLSPTHCGKSVAHAR